MDAGLVSRVSELLQWCNTQLKHPGCRVKPPRHERRLLSTATVRHTHLNRLIAEEGGYICTLSKRGDCRPPAARPPQPPRPSCSLVRLAELQTQNLRTAATGTDANRLAHPPPAVLTSRGIWDFTGPGGVQAGNTWAMHEEHSTQSLPASSQYCWGSRCPGLDAAGGVQ
jgi:hypothetical protein